MPALDIRHLAKTYRAGVAGCCAAARALTDVSLQVRRGEIVGLWGGPGAGKTTLLLCAAGALRPDRGEVRWFGAPAAAGERSARGVAYVARCPAEYGFLTPRQSLEHAAMRVHDAPPHSLRGVLPLLQRLGVDDVSAGRLRELPTGALRGLAVAHALLERPRLLLVDGPFDDIDAAWASSLALLLRAVAADGVACLVSARDYAMLRPVADRVVTLADGHAAARRWSATADASDGSARALASRVAEHDAR